VLYPQLLALHIIIFEMSQLTRVYLQHSPNQFQLQIPHLCKLNHDLNKHDLHQRSVQRPRRILSPSPCRNLPQDLLALSQQRTLIPPNQHKLSLHFSLLTLNLLIILDRNNQLNQSAHLQMPLLQVTHRHSLD